MQRLLILFLCVLAAANITTAQTSSPRSQKTKLQIQKGDASPEFVCNNAGTFVVGPAGTTSQTNDITPSRIFLCFGDSLLLNHNGDADLTGDPVLGTAAGIGWALYDCPPTIAGDNLQNILTDPCITPGGPSGVFIVPGFNQEGDLWLTNNGLPQNTFNSGEPVELFYAPITLDRLDFSVFPPVVEHESTAPANPPGPCVNVNTADAVSVVYLNGLSVSGISSNFGNDCLGKFRVQGGFPEFSFSATYSVKITKVGNPSVIGLIQTPSSTKIFDNADVIFSVPESGLYRVEIEDGISCGLTFQINMAACNPVDNINLSFPQVVAPPGSNVCLPIKVDNMNCVAASFSITWDPTILTYTGFTNVEASIDGFSAANFNAQNTGNGLLGVTIFDANPVGAPIIISNGGTLFSVCFDVIGALGQSTPIVVTNAPTPVIFENEQGNLLAVNSDTGRVVIDLLPLSMELEIDTLCFNNANIKVTPRGGDAPYEVTIASLTGGPVVQGTVASDGGTFTPATGSANGTYLITVIDQNGQGDTVTQTITLNIESLGAALNLTVLPSCNGANDGEVSVQVFVGNTLVNNPGPNFTFSWTGPDGPHPNAPMLSGRKAGTYSCVVTDNTSGCSAVATGTLGQPAPIKRDSLFTLPAECAGVCNGILRYGVDGGTPTNNTYGYNWNYAADGNPANAVSDVSQQAALTNLTGKCAGTYFVTVTDQNGCTFTDNVVIGNLRTVTINVVSTTPVSCNGGANGRVCVQAIELPSSAATFNFLWSPAGFTQTSPANNGSCYENLPANTYDVLAIGSNGCVASGMFEVTQPDSLSAVVDFFTNPPCDQPNAGRIQVRGVGGNATVDPNSYSYSWTTGATTRLIENLPPGDYCATITDLSGCTAVVCVTITIPLPPQITSVDSVQVKCGNDGCLTVNATGNNLTYVWKNSNGVNIPGGTTPTLCNLDGGDYIVEVKDQGGCTTRDTIPLATKPNLAIGDTTFILPTCFGLANGILTIAATGGNGGYTYSWAGGATGQTRVNLGVGNYTVTIKDAAGCTISAVLSMGQPPAIVNSFPANLVKGVTCFNGCNGVATPITLYADGSNGSFIYQWSDNSLDSARVTLCAGKAFVTISNSQGCFITDSVNITSPPVFEATVESIRPTKCFGGNDGSIGIAGTGGNGNPYTYAWSPNTNNASNTAVVNNLSAGTYTVTITDKQGCTLVKTYQVAEPNPITLQVNAALSKSPTCAGGNDGTAAVDVLGGNTGTVTYAWTKNNIAVGNSNPLINQPAGIYNVTVTDAQGCTGALENVQIEEPKAIIGRINPLVALFCNGDQLNLTIDTIYGGKGGPYQYSVDNGVVQQPTFPTSIGGGEHYITYFDNSGTCSRTDTIFIFEPDPILIQFDPTTIELELGDSIQLNPIISGTNTDSLASFVWNPTDRLFNMPSLNPVVYTFENQVYTLTLTDLKGCTGIGSVRIDIDPNRNVYIPNIFIAGNPEGLNDHFSPYIGPGVEQVAQMQVFDRWGTKVYEKLNFYPENQPSDGWDGRFRGEFVTPGVYVYTIEVHFLDKRVLVYRGDVTVYR
jgi:hypothetical protein